MRRIEATSSENTVPTPKVDRASEFEVQAYLYSALKQLGREVRGEVKWVQKREDGKRKRACRFDLVLYNAGVPIEILEVKAARVKHKNGVEATRQGCTYPTFGVPVTFIYGMKDANEYLRGIHA